MRAICVASASAVLLGVGALTSCVPAADAAVRTDFDFGVQPSTVGADAQVTLWVERNAACEGEAEVSSPVFDAVAIPPEKSSAPARVDADARPGAVYDVEFFCDGSSGTAHLTIAGDQPAHHPAHHPTRHHRHPSKGVHAGEGGTLGGLDLKEMGLGAALIAGALGTAYHLARRRTDEDTG
ncbi:MULTISPECIES: hypothetical protein [Streptomyces]|uniref:Lipoprotein n=1 Tax=Streptomyces chartreusis NRRL 3882 TaxID=1079985 RepID=A0A2N9B241_STRCX|nr:MULTISPECIES: hypothetical protein [Streptomyces]MYS88998.1 hypothetical protein [Streptomyces sp. SID5464]SOR77413.1 hypothetical protein SCNRRL3882_0885 [Streptomyces chartreusis NRRL 3882]